MATGGADGIKYYEAQSKFVDRNHPYADNARFRKRLPTLENIRHSLNELEPENASDDNAFDELVQLKADPEELYDLLRTIGVSSDEPIEWPRRERRPAMQLSEKCVKLARDIEHASKNWPYGTRMMYSDFEEWTNLPRILRSYADAWVKELARPYRSARSPRNENIVRLIRYVKDATGDYRYKQVADLLNATDAAFGWKTRDEYPRWNAANLSWIKFRAKNKPE